MSAGALLRKALNAGLVMAPNAHDGMSAKLIERSGFPAVYVGTGGLSAAVFGRADVEVTTLTEILIIVKAICDGVRIPVIVDADTGFGGIHNVIRTVREMEAAGVAAIHLEDQPVPKRCGYFPGGALISIDDMCDKIDAALNARRDPSFMIIARIDAGFITDFSEAIARARAYQNAGADMIFVNGMTTLEQARRVVEEAPGLHLYNVSGSDRAPIISAEEIAAMGYRLAIYPLHGMRLAGRIIQQMLADLKASGSIRRWIPEMMTFDEYQELSGAFDALALEKQYLERRTKAGNSGR